MKKQKDIIWILIDTLLIDFLNLTSNKRSLLEDMLLKGRLYTNAITAEKFTLGSLYSLGTGLYGSVNGMNGIDYNFSMEKPDILFVGDYLKGLGYATFHYSDRRFRHFPSSGIDIYELAPYHEINKTFGRTYDTPRRREILECFKNTASPKFLFLHMFVQHDMFYSLGRNGRVDTSEGYRRALPYMNKELRSILNALEITGDELLVIGTDHGAVVDIDFMKEETTKGTSMRPGNLKTLCSFISKDIEPKLINTRCSTIDILPTIFDLAGLPSIPVQGKSLCDTKGTINPICEAVEVYKFPFNRSCSSAFAKYIDNKKVVFKKNQKSQIFNIKGNKERKENKKDNDIFINEIGQQISAELSKSYTDIKKERIKELHAKKKKILLTNRNNLPVRIVLFVTDADIKFLDGFLDDMKAQIEHYFEIHFFNIANDYFDEKVAPDYRIKIHKERFKIKSINLILQEYKRKPEFIGFINTSNEYYEDYLYELRRLLEINPEKIISYAGLEKNKEITFLIRYNFLKEFINHIITTDALFSIDGINKYKNIIRHPYKLGSTRKKKVSLYPLDSRTTELLQPEGIFYKRKNELNKNDVDIIAFTKTEKLNEAQQLAKKYMATPIFIDYNSDTINTSIIPSDSINVIKRKDYQCWYVMKTESEVLSKKLWQLWDALEYCVYSQTNVKNKSKVTNIMKRKPIRYFTNLLLVKLSYLPLFNSYPFRKLLYSIDIKGFEWLGGKNTCVLKRKVPYTYNFNLTNLPLKNK